MARARKLKVYRTPIGFHDAYVAAPSRKAALEAWGTDRNLFARGVAEEVDDPELSADPLASPGLVIKRSRGTTAEQIAALPKDKPKRAVDTESKASGATPTRKARRASPPEPPPPPKPKPRRDGLAAAEESLAEAERRQRTERDALSRRERELARERERLESDQTREIERLQQEVDMEREAYDRARLGEDDLAS